MFLLISVEDAGDALADRAPARPANQWADFTGDGAWCWFSDPRAVYYEGKRNQTFAAWVSSDGSIMIGAYDHDSGKVSEAVLHERLEVDDHDVPSILIRADGRLMVFYSRHSEDDFYLKISEKAGDISSWSPARLLKVNDNEQYALDETRAYCYSNPFQLSEEGGRIFLFWRGIGNKPCVAVSANGGETWGPGRVLISPKETYKNQRPYLKYASNNKDRIHLAFTNGHPRREPTNGIYYACYREDAFYRADGSRFTGLDSIPFDPWEADVVYDAGETRVRAWVWDIAEDDQGYPVIVYTRLPEETDHRYHYARWDGTQWLDNEVVRAGRWFPQTPEGEEEREVHYSGGVVLDHGDPSVVYLARPVNDVFEIEKWVTRDLGRTWVSEAITQGSRYDNVRPFVVLNSSPEAPPNLLWMNNRRYLHYTDYQTSIKMNLPAGR